MVGWNICHIARAELELIADGLHADVGYDALALQEAFVVAHIKPKKMYICDN